MPIDQPIRRPGAVIGVACALALASAFALAVWAWQLRLQLAAATKADADFQAMSIAAPAEGGAIPDRRAFVHLLPSSNTLPTRAHTLIHTSQSEAAARGVQWLAATSTPQPGSERSLPKWDVSLTLQGSYTQVKAVLAQATERTPPVVIRRIEMRRAANGSDVEAELALMLIGQPGLGGER